MFFNCVAYGRLAILWWMVINVQAELILLCGEEEQGGRTGGKRKGKKREKEKK